MQTILEPLFQASVPLQVCLLILLTLPQSTFRIQLSDPTFHDSTGFLHESALLTIPLHSIQQSYTFTSTSIPITSRGTQQFLIVLGSRSRSRNSGGRVSCFLNHVLHFHCLLSPDPAQMAVFSSQNETDNTLRQPNSKFTIRSGSSLGKAFPEYLNLHL